MVEHSAHNIDADYLTKEVGLFYRQLYKLYPSDSFVSLYLQAHLHSNVLNALDTNELSSVIKVVNNKLDAVAIEPWLRKKGQKRHVLSSKLLLVSFLSECDSHHQEFFRKTRTDQFARLKAVTIPLIALPRYVFGFFLKYIYGIT
jgi:hypothetical protein